jgi:hypothetical protein
MNATFFYRFGPNVKDKSLTSLQLRLWHYLQEQPFPISEASMWQQRALNTLCSYNLAYFERKEMSYKRIDG